MGFLKKIKDTAKEDLKKGAEIGKDKLEHGVEKGIEKGAELGTKGFEGVKDAAKKGHDKAKSD